MVLNNDNKFENTKMRLKISTIIFNNPSVKGRKACIKLNPFLSCDPKRN